MKNRTDQPRRGYVLAMTAEYCGGVPRADCAGVGGDENKSHGVNEVEAGPHRSGRVAHNSERFAIG
jgi:hypothetical protein